MQSAHPFIDRPFVLQPGHPAGLFLKALHVLSYFFLRHAIAMQKVSDRGELSIEGEVNS
jgi:hypothetical protein